MKMTVAVSLILFLNNVSILIYESKYIDIYETVACCNINLNIKKKYQYFNSTVIFWCIV